MVRGSTPAPAVPGESAAGDLFNNGATLAARTD